MATGKGGGKSGGKSEGTVSRSDRDRAGRDLLDAAAKDVVKNGGTVHR